MNKKIIIALFAAGVAFAGCQSSTKPAAKPQSRQKPAPAEAAVVAEAPRTTPSPAPAPAPAPEAIVPNANLSDPVEQLFSTDAKPMTFQETPVAALFYLIGKQYGINILVDPDVKGTTLLRFNGGTLGDLIKQILTNNDLYMERDGSFMHIKKNRTVLYYIEYPLVNRTAKSTSSINLTQAASNNATGQNGGMGGNYGMTAQINTPNSQNQDSSSLTIEEQQGKDSFWESILSDIKTQSKSDETITVNPFSGLTTITTSTKRHAFWKDYLAQINRRINMQVIVEVHFYEVTLNDSYKLGIDWSQAASKIGGVVAGPVEILANLTKAGSATLPGDTVIGHFAIGKLSGVISALGEQGNVRTISKPTIHLLNNQKGFVKVGTDKTFWSVYSNVNITTASTAGQTTTFDIYQERRQTFGIVVPVTAQISEDNVVTLVMEPARTTLQDIDSSPDGRQNAPLSVDERISTMLRLRSGEAAIIGGLTQQSAADSRRGVPFISKIPLLGQLARTDVKVANTTEFIATVSVRIVK